VSKKTPEPALEYSRGYRAGLKKGKADAARSEDSMVAYRAMIESRQRFFDDAMVSILPFCFTQNIWKTGDQPINTVDERVNFAAQISKAALRERAAQS
jgi:hypothetical protein